MVTRKAIEAAFEVIVGDIDVVEVLYYCFRDGTPLEKVCRVSVRRDMEFPDRYTVILGLLGKGEREWFWEQTVLKEVSPKIHIRTWMYWKEKRAWRRRLEREKHAKA